MSSDPFYTLDEYQKDAMRTADASFTDEQRLTEAGLGVAGEAGEFADLIKKLLFHGHPLDKDKAIKELGDVMWYLAQAATGLHTSLSHIATVNIEKLQKRYPDGFTSERSLNRIEE